MGRVNRFSNRDDKHDHCAAFTGSVRIVSFDPLLTPDASRRQAAGQAAKGPACVGGVFGILGENVVKRGE